MTYVQTAAGWPGREAAALLKKLWQGTAEYADAVIALLLAVVLGVLGAFSVTSQNVTSAGILTTLAVLAVVILRDRVNKASLDHEIRSSTSQSQKIPETRNVDLSAEPVRLAAPTR